MLGGVPAPFLRLPLGGGSHYGTGGKCDTLRNWHIGCNLRCATMGRHHKAMANHVDWFQLEQSGKLPAQHGREEAISSTLAQVAAKKAAKDAKPSQDKRK